MTPIEILRKLDLLCWSVIFFGFRKGWVSRKDLSGYALYLLNNGSNDEGVALIASAENLEDEELLSLISSQIETVDDALDIEKWRLANLIQISELNANEQMKVNRLQEVYANFGYPEDMASCSIYSQDKVDPLVAMMEVIAQLRVKLDRQINSSQGSQNVSEH
ncbi:DUF2247 family protein [Candidatus Sororendozoicomonas aggregata]|uniref:DUF2247 family protein n=1 Tax=Candidatus Sororendozoicomonas aggregata TaxID=3073239 RepID=UPI002ED05D92